MSSLAALTAAASGAQTPLWATAAASAVGGALVGGLASYLGNVRLINVQRRFRAAVRRKAKVYVPLKLELQQLQSSIEEDEHLRWGIKRDDDPGHHRRAPVFVFWGKLVEDGRVSFAMSNKVRARMQSLDQAVEGFLDVRAAAGEALEAVGRPLYGEVTGNDQFDTGFDGYAMAEAVRNPEAPWQHWELPQIPGFEEFRERFNATPQVEPSRAAVLGAEEELKRKLNEAIQALDEGITSISKREEKESPKD